MRNNGNSCAAGENANWTHRLGVLFGITQWDQINAHAMTRFYNSTLGHTREKCKCILCIPKDMYGKDNRNIVHNSPKLQATEMSSKVEHVSKCCYLHAIIL